VLLNNYRGCYLHRRRLCYGSFRGVGGSGLGLKLKIVYPLPAEDAD